MHQLVLAKWLLQQLPLTKVRWSYLAIEMLNHMPWTPFLGSSRRVVPLGYVVVSEGGLTVFVYGQTQTTTGSFSRFSCLFHTPHLRQDPCARLISHLEVLTGNESK